MVSSPPCSCRLYIETCLSVFHFVPKNTLNVSQLFFNSLETAVKHYKSKYFGEKNGKHEKSLGNSWATVFLQKFFKVWT